MARMTRAARRTQIAQGAMSAFATHGYARATIQKIADEAGITSGLIHYHFDSKRAILLEVLQRLSDRLAARFATARGEDALEASSPRAAGDLDAFIEAHVGVAQGVDADAIACWVAIAAEAVHLPEVREPFEQVVQRQRDELTDILTTHHACAHEEAAAIAAAILSMIHGAYLLSRSTEAVLHTGFAAARLRAAAHGMIRAAADMEARHD